MTFRPRQPVHPARSLSATEAASLAQPGMNLDYAFVTALAVRVKAAPRTESRE